MDESERHIRNFEDGTVEIICGCRDSKHLEDFKKEITLIGTDQYSAHVEDITTEDIPSRELRYFDVDYGGDVTNKDIATKIDIGSNVMRSMNTEIINRFDTMGSKYDTIGTTLIKLERHFIKLEEHFGKLVEEFIGQKKKEL